MNRDLALPRSALLLALLHAAAGSVSRAQERLRQPGFDISRAWIADSTIFHPFLVQGTTPLRQVLSQHLVDEDTPLLVVDQPGGRLALITAQLAYHHVAQGDIKGEPWMVSF